MDSELFRYEGKVIEGKKKARLLGFPTANISAPGITFSGAFAGKVLIGDFWYKATLYADPERELLEAHILDFEDTIYGEMLTIVGHEKVADRKKFTGLDDLKEHIRSAVLKAREYFEK